MRVFAQPKVAPIYVNQKPLDARHAVVARSAMFILIAIFSFCKMFCRLIQIVNFFSLSFMQTNKFISKLLGHWNIRYLVDTVNFCEVGGVLPDRRLSEYSRKFQSARFRMILIALTMEVYYYPVRCATTCLLLR